MFNHSVMLPEHTLLQLAAYIPCVAKETLSCFCGRLQVRDLKEAESVQVDQNSCSETCISFVFYWSARVQKG